MRGRTIAVTPEIGTGVRNMRAQYYLSCLCVDVVSWGDETIEAGSQYYIGTRDSHQTLTDTGMC